MLHYRTVRRVFFYCVLGDGTAVRMTVGKTPALVKKTPGDNTQWESYELFYDNSIIIVLK